MDRDGRRERRHFPRASILGTASVRWERVHQATYLIANLSPGGARLFGTRPIPVGTKTEIVLDVGRRHVHHVEATVSRLNVRSVDDVDLAVTLVGTTSEIVDAVESEVSLARDHAPGELKSAIVVDASDGDRHALTGGLHTLGRTTFAVATPTGAVDFVSHPKARVDVALVALAEECAEGIDFLVFVAERHPSARRILLVADVDEHLARARAFVGDCVLLRKPWTLPELARALGD